jgi:hypothetical protein
MESYGGTPEEWVGRPGWMVDMFLRMIDKISAERYINICNAVMIGAGTMEKSDRMRIIAKWSAAIRSGEVKRKLNKEQAAVMLASIGIGVKWPATKSDQHISN